MKGIIAPLLALPLDRRFLVPPILALVLIGTLVAGFVMETQGQNALVDRVAQRDLASFAAHDDLFTHRSEEYTRSAALAFEVGRGNAERGSELLAAARDQYLALDREHARMLETQRDALRDELVQRAEAHRARAQLLGAAALALALLLAAYWLGLGRKLMASLETRIAALVDAHDRSLEDARAHAETTIANRTAGLAAANAELRCDVDRRTETERHLRLYQSLVRSTGEAVAIADGDGLVIDVNPAYERVSGLQRDEVVGTPFLGTLAGSEPDTMRNAIWTALRSNGQWSGEVLDRRRSGETFPAWVTANAFPAADGTGFYVSVLRDISSLHECDPQLGKLAFQDPLTGLANRTLLEDRTRIALSGAGRWNEKVAILDLDIDQFGALNRTLGADRGDRLLEEVARRLSAQVRAFDTVARVDADEFVIVLAGIDREDEATAVAARILEDLRRPMDLGGETLGISASIGIAMYPADGADSASVRQYAGVALAEARLAGGGQCRRFALDMVDRAGKRLTLGTQIESALEGDRFSLHYQPILDLNAGTLTGIEALLRWRQSDGTYIPPSLFLPHAAEAGLSHRLDRWVLERACRDVADWSHWSEQSIEVSVNISAATLQAPGFAFEVRGILDRSGLPAHQLRLEITEAAIIANPKAVGEILREIRALGVGVSLDDFGTGYSSLNYLIQFPIDRIKLDRSFVERIGKDPASEAIIRSLLDLARRLSIGVVAEGVEHASQHDFLLDAGCGHIQGYHVAMPLPCEELAQLMASEPREMARRILPLAA